MNPAIPALQVSLAAGLTLLFLLLLYTLVETLMWWRTWCQFRYPEEDRVIPQGSRARLRCSRAIVLLTGTSDYADPSLTAEQQSLLDALQTGFPGCAVIGGHIPAPLRATGQYTKWDIWSRMGFRQPPLLIIALHNFWQLLLAVWCERTYGDHVARSVTERLWEEGVEPGGDLVIIGGSAGAQVALAAAPELVRHFPCRITLIALGGVFGSPRGIGVVRCIVHLVGDRDQWSRRGNSLFPSRYLPRSLFRHRLKAGDVLCATTGKHRHFGPEGYFGRSIGEPSGQSYEERTREVLLALSIWREIGFE